VLLRSRFENLKEINYTRNLDVDDNIILDSNFKEMWRDCGLDANLLTSRVRKLI
jgi:hypothetical protein